MAARLAAALCVLALAAPASALAQAFDPLPPAPPPQPVTQAPDQEAEDDDGLSRTQQLLIGLSGIVLLIGIAWAIVRDARTTAPAESRPAPGDAPRRRGTRRPAGARHQESRARAKAARRARKRARKR